MPRPSYSTFRHEVDQLKHRLKTLLSSYAQHRSNDTADIVVVSAASECLAETAMVLVSKERALMVLAEVARMVALSDDEHNP